MQGRPIANRIAEYRRSGELDKAIEQAQTGIAVFTELNFFYKILGDLLWDKGNYLEAGEAYIGFLERINEETQYFKNFVKFKYKFASLDAMIAGTATYHSDKDLTVITHDRSFRKALEAGGVHTLGELPDSIWVVAGSV